MDEDAVPQCHQYYRYKTAEELRQAWEARRQAAELAKRRDEALIQYFSGTSAPPITASSAQTAAAIPAQADAATPASSAAIPPRATRRNQKAVYSPIGSKLLREYQQVHHIPYKDRKSHFGLGPTSFDTAFAVSHQLQVVPVLA